jgi:predicted Zn finger-like uncharacterized protein
MRVSCPGCQTEYDVPDAALAGRTRTLRCAKCGHQWAAPFLDPNAILADQTQELPDTRPLRALPEPAPERPRSIFSEAPTPTPDPAPPAWPLTSDIPAPLPFTPPPLPPLPPLPPAYPSPAPAETPIAEAPPPPPRWEIPAPSPDDALARREQAERENFAALIEASRQNVLNDEEPAKGSGNRKSANPWLVSILILAVAIALIWLERGNIMKAWPPSARILGNLGMVWINLTQSARALLKL